MDVQVSIPPETWLKILKYLPLQVLCRVVLVSKYFHSLGSEPSLWNKCSISRRKLRSHGLKSLMTIVRYTQVEKLDMSVTWLTAGQCTSLIQDSLETNLQHLNLYGVDLSLVDAQLLAKAVARLHKVNLGWTRLTGEQSIAVFREIVKSDGSLADMNMFRVNLSDVPSDLLAEAVSRLTIVKLTNTQLRTDQLVALLEQIMCPGSKLQNLNLTGVNLSFVEPQLLGVALSGLTSFTLWGTKLTISQCISILEEMMHSKTLTSVNMDSQDLSSVDPEVLSLAVSRLSIASLFDTRLTTQQCVKLLNQVIKSTTLTHLNLDFVAMGDVPLELREEAGTIVKILNS